MLRGRITYPEERTSMHLSFVAQPDQNLGPILFRLLEEKGQPHKIRIVSAFASFAAVLRLKPYMEAVHESGGDVRLVLGVDMGGTSREVLQEVASWQSDVTIIKNRFPGMTFHPKIYYLAWGNEAHLFVGSNNLTDGGLFKNYEAATHISFILPDEDKGHAHALEGLQRFLEPTGDTARRLTPEYLEILRRVPMIPSEAEARIRRQEGMRAAKEGRQAAADAFGSEPIPSVPGLPAELQQRVIAERQRQRAEAMRRAKELTREATKDEEPVTVEVPAPAVQLDPESFLMTLPKLQNEAGNIPGEIRIPLVALELAQEFWGWPDNYATVMSPRGGEDRIYREWRSPWRIYLADNLGAAQISPNVRLYFYENSSDFRFYARQVVNLGANTGDIVRIRRVDDQDATFDCAVALRGTPIWDDWNAICINEARGGRRFAFI